MRPMWGCILVAALLLGGCSAKESAKASYAKGESMSSDAAMATPEEPGEAVGGAEMNVRTAGASFQPNARVKIQRSMIRRAQLTVRVDNVEKAEKAANALVTKVGGFVEGSASNDLSSAEAQITMTVRVPVNTFDQTLVDFEALGTRTNKSIKGEDVTGQVLDYGARIKVMRAQEEVYRGLLKQSKRLDDIVSVQQKLMELRENIESTTAQLQGLSELAALSTIELTLSQSKEAAEAMPKDQGWAGESWAQAKAAAGAVLKALLVIGMYLVLFCWLWVPAVWLIRRAMLASKAKPRPVTPPPPPRQV